MCLLLYNDDVGSLVDSLGYISNSRLMENELGAPIVGCIDHDDWWRPEFYPSWFVAPNYGFLYSNFLFCPPFTFKFEFGFEGGRHILFFVVYLIGIYSNFT